jgi:hypothetical protein
MISRGVLLEIIAAVERAGGDLQVVKDLVEVWERLERVRQPRVDAMRREARTVRCRCAAGERGLAGRCTLCFGQTAERSAHASGGGT